MIKKFMIERHLSDCVNVLFTELEPLCSLIHSPIPYLLFRKAFKNLPHILTICIESLSSLRRQAKECSRYLVYKLFFDLYIAGLFQLTQMRREVPPRQTCLVHQEDEVGALNNVQISQNQKTRRFVDDPVDVRQGLQAFAVEFMLFHQHPPGLVDDCA